MTFEEELRENVEEFFNLSDFSVGIYPVGKIDDNVVSDFSESEGIEKVYHIDDKLYFECENNKYCVEFSEKHEQWKMFKIG